MEAKDTVMTLDEIRKVVGRFYDGGTSGLERVAIAQSKLSFKAGYKQAREEMDIQLISLADLCLEHRQEGRREVVDFTNSFWSGKDIWKHPEGQAKLKEWGI